MGCGRNWPGLRPSSPKAMEQSVEVSIAHEFLDIPAHRAPVFVKSLGLHVRYSLRATGDDLFVCQESGHPSVEVIRFFRFNAGKDWAVPATVWNARWDSGDQRKFTRNR